MIIGNYGGDMAYATKPLFCVAYLLEFINKDPAAMTFRNPDNHPVVFMGKEMIVCQLLVRDCPEYEYVKASRNRHLLFLEACNLVRSYFHR